jgi:tetratricopeptide (TPR) repeat protein
MVNATTYRCPDGGRRGTGSAVSGRFLGWRLGAAALALLLAGLPGTDAFAQSKKSAKAAEEAQPNQAAAQRAYAAGTKSFEAGDMAAAEQQLSVALAGGGLPNAQMARALYLRGAAYRRLGRPAQAISDLTTAVWLKGGLNDADKAKATEERQLAYREAGLGDTPPPIGAAPLDQSPKTPGTPPPPSGAQVVHVTQQSFWNNFSLPSLSGSSQPAQAPAAPAQTQTQESSSFWSFLPSFTGSSESAQPASAAAPAVGFASDPGLAAASQGASQGTGTVTLAEAAPPAAAPAQSWETQTAAAGEAPAAQALTVSSGYAPQPPPDTGINPMGMAAADPAPAPSGNPLAGTGTAVSNFFGNMFGSSSNAAPASPEAPAAVMTGSTVQPGGSWGPDTTVVTSQTSSMVQRGPDSPPPQSDPLPWAAGGGASPAPASAPVKVAAAGGAGKYKLQVAAVRSREEAERLVQTLSAYQPVRDGVVSPEIDEAVIGSMGTFYRVRLGPYADAKEPNQLCTTLKPQGFDCLVVTQ